MADGHVSGSYLRLEAGEPTDPEDLPPARARVREAARHADAHRGGGRGDGRRRPGAPLEHLRQVLRRDRCDDLHAHNTHIYI